MQLHNCRADCQPDNQGWLCGAAPCCHAGMLPCPSRGSQQSIMQMSIEENKKQTLKSTVPHRPCFILPLLCRLFVCCARSLQTFILLPQDKLLSESFNSNCTCNSQVSIGMYNFRYFLCAIKEFGNINCQLIVIWLLWFQIYANQVFLNQIIIKHNQQIKQSCYTYKTWLFLYLFQQRFHFLILLVLRFQICCEFECIFAGCSLGQFSLLAY